MSTHFGNHAEPERQRRHPRVGAPAAADGRLHFWISAINGFALRLSTDDNPTNATQIATVAVWTNAQEWTKETNQKSAAIALTAGKKYYIEALQKEGTGGDSLAVAWGGSR